MAEESEETHGEPHDNYHHYRSEAGELARQAENDLAEVEERQECGDKLRDVGVSLGLPLASAM